MNPLSLLIFLFLLSFGATVFVLQMEAPGGEKLEHVRVEIQSGESLHDIAQTLRRHGLIRSALAFRLYMKSQELDTAVRAGSYTIPPHASFGNIAEILASGEASETRVTIPEGFTLAQIDALLAHMGLIEQGAVEECAGRCDFSSFEFLPAPSGMLEGYLFPDTYFVDAAEFVPKFFLERMLGTFRKRVVASLVSDVEASGRTLEEIVIMASLVEREAAADEERPVIAGILWKRHDAGRGLDVDATIRYVLHKDTEALTKEDLDVDSPYNTRRYAGLPPGPIANPGLESIEAALHPEDSPYWYYLHGKDGRVHYSETNEEHNGKKAKYL